MGRIFNSDYPVSLGTSAEAAIMADKIAEISNGKFSVYSVTGATILLQYLNTNLVLEITVNSSFTYLYVGSISTGSYVRNDSYNAYVYYRSNFRICYSEIDGTVCCLTLISNDGYLGGLSGTSALSFTIANTLINNNNYLTCCFDTRSNSAFGANIDSSLLHFTAEGNWVGGTQYGLNIMSLYDLHINNYYTGTALLVPYYFVANAANHTLMGEIQFSGQNGKKLYALLPPTSDGLVDPRENYIINGVSYKACGDIIKLFL